MQSTSDAARDYHARGWNPLPLRPGNKRPIGSEWQRTKTNPDEFDTLFNGKNIGVALGDASGGLVDVDLDDPLVVKIYPRFAKSYGIVTPAVFGRKSKPHSHHLYQLQQGDKVSRNTFADGDKMLAEIRGDGHQTMFPPSVHPDNEPIQWVTEDASPLVVPYKDVRRTLGWTVGAALLIRNWDDWQDSHHVLIGALAGGFARSGVGAKLTESFVRVICHYTGDHEPDDRIRIVRDTYAKLEANDASVTGFPMLRQHIGSNRVRLLIDWLQLKRANDNEEDRPTCSDDGNARRLVNLYGESVRYVHEWEKWLVWDGSRWQPDRSEIIVGYAREVPSAIRKEAETANDDEIQEALEKWANASRNITRIQAIPKLARTDERVKIASERLDANPWAFNVQNGTINLQTGGISSHEKDDYITKKSPILYNPRAECPTWLYYLNSIFAKNQTLIDFVQRAVGYTLTGRTTENVFFIMHGPQGTGKTTFIEVLRRVLGEYARNADPSSFMQKKHTSRANPEIAQLQGARFVSSSETEENEQLATALVKRLSGESRITAAHLYAAPFEFDPVMKLWIDTNHKPRIPAHDDAAWARLVLLPFVVEFRHKPTEIKGLKYLLYTELPGILRWAVEGCLSWQSDGLQRPAIVTDAVDEYRTDSDSLAVFIDEACVVDPTATCGSNELRAAYTEWCKGANERPATSRTFKTRMQEHGYDVKRTEQGIRWQGIRPASTRAQAEPFAQASPFQRPNTTTPQA